jgi:transketolase
MDCEFMFALDNHSGYGGLGDLLLNALMSSSELRARRLTKFAIDEFPACGTPKETLAYHKLDGRSLAERIAGVISKQ